MNSNSPQQDSCGKVPESEAGKEHGRMNTVLFMDPLQAAYTFSSTTVAITWCVSVSLY